MSTDSSSQKRVPRGPITFKIKLTDEQKEAKALILQNKITFLSGKAGSGKSMLAVQIALDLLFRREISKIYITRPAVDAGESYGYMPGGISEKLAPYTDVIYDHMYDLYDKEKIDKYVEEGRIVIAPIGFIRGKNFKDAVIIIDEAQNLTKKQLKLLMTRICIGAKMIFMGDGDQIDLKNTRDSGLTKVSTLLCRIPGIVCITLLQNYRDPIVELILDALGED